MAMNDIVEKLRQFIENEAQSCSMDFGCMTPLYVYRMWGGQVALDVIIDAMKVIRNVRTTIPNR